MPKSFLNRFTRVHVEPMDDDDLAHVARALYPAMPAKVVEGMVAFVTRLATAANEPGGTFARRGAPWEFNLRDVLRWCELADAYQPEEEEDEQDEDEGDDEKEEGKGKGLLPDDEGDDGPAPSEPTCATFRALDATFETLFVRRLRCAEDRATCASLFEAAFGRRPTARPPPAPSIRDGALRVGGATFPVGLGGSGGGGSRDAPLGLLRSQMGALEAAAHCAARGWMTVFVGAHASGKTSVARALASLAGRTLRQVALTPPRTVRAPRFVRAARAGSDAPRSKPSSWTPSSRHRGRRAPRGWRKAASPSPSPSEPEPGRARALSENNSRAKAVDLVESAWAAWGAYRAIADETAALETTATAADAARARDALETAVESLERLLLSSSGTDAGDDTRLIRGGSAGVPNDASRRDSSTHGKIASIRARLASLGAEAWGGGAPAAGRVEWVVGGRRRAATEGEWVLLEREPVFAGGARPAEPSARDERDAARERERRGERRDAAGRRGAPGLPPVPRARPEEGGGEPSHAKPRRRGVPGEPAGEPQGGDGDEPRGTDDARRLPRGGGARSAPRAALGDASRPGRRRG